MHAVDGDLKTPGGSKCGVSHAIISRSSSTIRDGWPGGPAVQILLTLLSGVPHTGQTPWESSPWRVLAFSVGAMVLGVSLSLLGHTLGGLGHLLFLPGWVLTVYALRNLALSVFHEAAHGTMCPRLPWLNEWVGQCASVLLLSQNFRIYRPEHLGDHHCQGHMTCDDPTVAFLFDRLGLRPGMAKNECWRRLVWKLISPWFHARLLWSRLVSWFRGAIRGHQVGSVLYLVALFGFAWWYPLATLLVWLIPLTVLVNVAMTVRACTEHVFAGVWHKGRLRIALSTHAQRFGCAAPTMTGVWSLDVLRWVWWGVKMACHTLCRVIFTPGESPQHDWHHRRINDKNWPSAIFARLQAVKEWEQAEMQGRQSWPPYTEVWGIIQNIDECFRTLSLCRMEDFVRGDTEVRTVRQ